MICQEHLVQVQKKLKNFRQHRVNVVAISFEPLDRIKYYKKAQELKVAIYSDVSKAVYGAFGMTRAKTSAMLHPKAVLKYAKLLVRGFKIEKPQADVYQLGGNVITDTSGKIRYMYQSKRPDDRPSVDDLLAEVKKL